MSPIESLLGKAMIDNRPNGFVLVDTHGQTLPSDADPEDGDQWVWVSYNEQVESYRVDFMLRLDSSVMLAVECDGHDFHDRTKQQAAYDRSRDRELLRLGIVTIRFTGSEIVHSPERCAFEIYQTILTLKERLLDIRAEAFRRALKPYIHGPRPRLTKEMV